MTTPKKPSKKFNSKAEALPIASDEIFQVVAALNGFDIQGFDEWLNRMEPCGAKDELSERRRWAWEAVRPGPGNINHDALLRHLEWMLLRWKYIRREEYILPLARSGKLIDDARKKPKRAELQQWIDKQVSNRTGETAKQIWERAPQKFRDDIGFERFTKRVTAARKKAGIGRK